MSKYNQYIIEIEDELYNNLFVYEETYHEKQSIEDKVTFALSKLDIEKLKEIVWNSLEQYHYNEGSKDEIIAREYYTKGRDLLNWFRYDEAIEALTIVIYCPMITEPKLNFTFYNYRQ